MGTHYPEHIIRETLEDYAANGDLTKAAAARGVPKGTAHGWKVAALAGRGPELSEPLTPAVPLAVILDESTRHAVRIARESLDASEPSPERAQAAAKVMSVAGNLHLDHTVGRRGTQPQNVTVVNGTDAILALVQARLALAAPEVSIEEVSDGQAPEV